MKKKNKEFKLNLKRTWQYIKSSKFNLVGYGTVSIIEAVISAIIPLLTAKVILNLTDGIMGWWGDRKSKSRKGQWKDF